MAKPNFFNENSNRAFPFVTGTVGIDVPDSGAVSMLQLPSDFIVDCGFIISSDVPFDVETNHVFLHEIRRPDTNTVTYEFRLDVAGFESYPLVFTRSVNDKDYTTEFLNSEGPYSSASSASASSSVSIYDASFWSGYLVTGSISSVVDRIAVGNAVTRVEQTESIVEPALLQVLDKAQVTSINLANTTSTRSVADESCDQYTWADPEGTYTHTRYLQEHVALLSGHNIMLTQDVENSTIVIRASEGAGLGKVCKEIPAYPGESPPEGSTNGIISGDYYCNEVYRTVNGIPGPHINLIGEDGVSILTDNVSNTVIVDIFLSNVRFCDSSYSCI